MKIVVTGTGYVGFVHAAVCSEYGHEVYAYDNDTDKIKAFSSGNADAIEHYVNEPGLTNIVRETLGKSLFFTSDLESVIEGVDVIFMCLPTPPNLDGSTNLTFYDAAAENIGQILAKKKNNQRVVLVNKSTVPIGTARHLEKIISAHGVKNFGVASNPEFLAEGTAVLQARRPDRVVVGCDNADDFKILRRVYSQFVNHVRIKYIETTPETAEAIKYVANTMLLTYISFWNGVGAKIGEKIPNDYQSLHAICRFEFASRFRDKSRTKTLFGGINRFLRPIVDFCQETQVRNSRLSARPIATAVSEIE